eukprot:1159995-Pelagomonas_calceolata.AAC.3
MLILHDSALHFHVRLHDSALCLHVRLHDSALHFHARLHDSALHFHVKPNPRLISKGSRQMNMANTSAV